MAGEEEAGYYRVSSRLAAFIPFFLMATNNVMAPRISALYSEGKTENLQKILTYVARGTMFVTFPLFVVVLLWPKEIINLFFGSEYVIAYISFIILVIANFFSVLMGQVGQVMALTGHEKITAVAVFFSVIINIILNLILVPDYGMNGATIATALSIVIWNGILAYWTVRKTGLHCTILGPMGKGSP